MEQYEWLCVHFGYNIFQNKVSAAMGQTSLEGMRVTVDCPWEHPSNMLIAHTLATVAETQKLLAESTTATLKNMNSAATSYEGHVSTSAAALEHEMSKGIANFLKDGHVVASNYKYSRKIEQTVGDLDCLVEGKLPDVGEVVVIGEVKTNMPNKHVEAALQLEANVERWKELCDFVPTDDPTDDDEKAMLTDYRELQVERLRVRPVVRAFGGTLFTPALDPYFKKKMGDRKWLRVDLDGATAKVVAQ
jgi:hypothetical protein